VPLMQDTETGGVVAMLVADADACKLLQSDANRFQPSSGFARR